MLYLFLWLFVKLRCKSKEGGKNSRFVVNVNYKRVSKKTINVRNAKVKWILGWTCLIVKLFKTFSCKKLIVLLQLNFINLKKPTKQDCMMFIDSTIFVFYKKHQSNIGTNSKEELSRINAQAQKAGPTSAKKVLKTP